MKTKEDNTNALAVRYLGRALIALIIGFFMYLTTSIGYNTYLSFSKEKIEVRAENSNSLDKRWVFNRSFGFYFFAKIQIIDNIYYYLNSIY